MCGEKRDWESLCEAASKEQDPNKLMVLISELMKALDERKKSAGNAITRNGLPTRSEIRL